MFWKKFCLTRNKRIFLEFLVELDVLTLGTKLNRQPGDWLVIFFTNTIVFCPNVGFVVIPSLFHYKDFLEAPRMTPAIVNATLYWKVFSFRWKEVF